MHKLPMLFAATIATLFVSGCGIYGKQHGENSTDAAIQPVIQRQCNALPSKQWGRLQTPPKALAENFEKDYAPRKYFYYFSNPAGKIRACGMEKLDPQSECRIVVVTFEQASGSTYWRNAKDPEDKLIICGMI